MADNSLPRPREGDKAWKDRDDYARQKIVEDTWYQDLYDRINWGLEHTGEDLRRINDDLGIERTRAGNVTTSGYNKGQDYRPYSEYKLLKQIERGIIDEETAKAYKQFLVDNGYLKDWENDGEIPESAYNRNTTVNDEGYSHNYGADFKNIARKSALDVIKNWRVRR